MSKTWRRKTCNKMKSTFSVKSEVTVVIHGEGNAHNSLVGRMKNVFMPIGDYLEGPGVFRVTVAEDPATVEAWLLEQGAKRE